MRKTFHQKLIENGNIDKIRKAQLEERADSQDELKGKGCCGNPSKCAFTVATGRCLPREEYERDIETGKVKPSELSFAQKQTLGHGRSSIERAREDVRKKQKRERTDGRGLSR